METDDMSDVELLAVAAVEAVVARAVGVVVGPALSAGEFSDAAGRARRNDRGAWVWGGAA